MLDAHTRELITIITQRYLSVLRFCRWSKLVRHQKSARFGSEIRMERSHSIFCTNRHKIDIISRVNDTTGYTLVKRRHSRVPTYLQRETDTADWSTPTFTLSRPKNGGVYPATSTFPRIVPRFSVMYPDLSGSGTLPSTIFYARIPFRSQQRTPKSKPSCSKQAMATGIIACLGGRSAPTKEHQNINSPYFKHTTPLFYSVERTVATGRETKGHTDPNLPA